MKNELICDDIDKIKEKYSCSFFDGICWVENELNYSRFKYLANDLKLDEKIEAKKKRLENNIKLSEEKKISTKKLLDEILHEYNTIKKNAKDKFDSYDSLIRQFDNSYINDTRSDILKGITKILQLNEAELSCFKAIKDESAAAVGFTFKAKNKCYQYLYNSSRLEQIEE